LNRLKKDQIRIFYSYGSETHSKEISASLILSNQFPITHIDYFFVNQKIRGKGIGTKFLNDFLLFLKEEKKCFGVSLECEEKLVDFYKKFYFNKANTLPTKFDDDDDKEVKEKLFYLMFLNFYFDENENNNKDDKDEDVKKIEEFFINNYFNIKELYGYELFEKNNIRIWKSFHNENNKIEGTLKK
jgi:GNAT superfamily N-acetyltransferase